MYVCYHMLAVAYSTVKTWIRQRCVDPLPPSAGRQSRVRRAVHFEGVFGVHQALTCIQHTFCGACAPVTELRILPEVASSIPARRPRRSIIPRARLRVAIVEGDQGLVDSGGYGLSLHLIRNALG